MCGSATCFQDTEDILSDNNGDGRKNTSHIFPVLQKVTKSGKSYGMETLPNLYSISKRWTRRSQARSFPPLYKLRVSCLHVFRSKQHKKKEIKISSMFEEKNPGVLPLDKTKLESKGKLRFGNNLGAKSS